MTFDSILRKKAPNDWEEQPVPMRLPHTKSVEEWLTGESSGIWTKMIHKNSTEFENSISKLDDDLSLVRTQQYLMSTLLGKPGSTHMIIFTQSVWNLFDYGLVPQDLAALQVHRMLRKYLSDW
jgi:hypothetical protein